MRQTCLNAIFRLAKADPRVVFIGSDLGSGTLSEFKEAFPERFFMEGILEAHIVGMAAGLALEGKIVYVNTISSFLTRRCFEQIVLDLCYHRVNVRLIGNGGGLVYAPLGPTHMTFEDIAILRTLPHMTILAPADAQEMERLMPLTLDHPGPLYIRLAKGYDPIVTDCVKSVAIGRAVAIQKGRHALILTTGITLEIALKAADLLRPKGIEAGILHLHTLKPLDTDAILDAMHPIPVVVTIEEHSIIGGLGSCVAEIIAETGFSPPKRFKRLGMGDAFPDTFGTQKSQLEAFNISTTHLLNVIENLYTLSTESN